MFKKVLVKMLLLSFVIVIFLNLAGMNLTFDTLSLKKSYRVKLLWWICSNFGLPVNLSWFLYKLLELISSIFISRNIYLLHFGI